MGKVSGVRRAIYRSLDNTKNKLRGSTGEVTPGQLADDYARMHGKPKKARAGGSLTGPVAMTGAASTAAGVGYLVAREASNRRKK